jgi:hypothetical protein
MRVADVRRKEFQEVEGGAVAGGGDQRRQVGEAATGTSWFMNAA